MNVNFINNNINYLILLINDNLNRQIIFTDSTNHDNTTQ